MPDQWWSFCLVNPHLDWSRVRTQSPSSELTEDIVNFLTGKLVGRGASSFKATGVIEGLGIKGRPIDYRFSQVSAQLQGLLVWGPAAQRPLFLLGAAHNGNEIRAFHHQMKKLQPPVGISTTPSEIVELKAANPRRTQHFRIYSSAVGGLLGGDGMCSCVTAGRWSSPPYGMMLGWRWKRDTRK